MTFKYRYRKQILIGIIIIFFLAIGGASLYIYLPKKKPVKDKEIVITKKKENKSNNKIINLKNKEEVDSKIMVDVKGYVANPGIYTLNEGSRVIDAINAAGGAVNNADTSVLNLSKKLTDEMVIIVYSYQEVEKFKEVKEEEKIVQSACEKGVNDIHNDACIINEIKEDKTESNSLISINTATIEELMSLDGVGESKAKAIVEYREKNGPFEQIEDLLNVSGIGDSLLAKIKENITL